MIVTSGSGGGPRLSRASRGWPGGRGVLAGALFFSVALGAAVFAGRVSAGDAAAGRQKAAACVPCHGALGLSVLPNAPNLAGQPDIYFIEQMRAYRSGKRGSEVMGVVARPMSDRDIDDLAAWYSSIRIEVKPPD